MDNAWSLIIRVKDGKVSVTTARGGSPIDANVDFGSNDTRRKLVALFERWMREGKITKRDELEALGTLLYEMIFPTSVGDFFLKKLAEFEGEKKKDPKMKDCRLRVELEISQPDLAGLPWEFLFRPGTETAKSFFLSSRTALVLSRFIPLVADRPELEACEELKVLVIDMLSPADKAPPDRGLPVVFQSLERFLANQDEEDRKLAVRPPQVAFKYKILRSPDVSDLQEALLEFRPHVLHYIGNGSLVETEVNSISLRSDDHKCPIRWLAHQEFAELFQNFQPKLVFLHLWHSPESAQTNFASLAPALITMEIRGVVALRYPLTLEAAQTFTERFYRSLLNCETVASAVQEGRYWLSTVGKHSSVGSPVLFLQSNDGPIAVRPPPAAPSEPGLTGVRQFAPPNPGGGAAIPEDAGAMDPSATTPSAPLVPPSVPDGSASSSDTRGGAPDSGGPDSPKRKETDVNPLGARAKQLKPIEPGTSGN